MARSEAERAPVDLHSLLTRIERIASRGHRHADTAEEIGRIWRIHGRGGIALIALLAERARLIEAERTGDESRWTCIAGSLDRIAGTYMHRVDPVLNWRECVETSIVEWCHAHNWHPRVSL